MIGKLFLTVSIRHLLNVLTETNETVVKREKKTQKRCLQFTRPIVSQMHSPLYLSVLKHFKRLALIRFLHKGSPLLLRCFLTSVRFPFANQPEISLKLMGNQDGPSPRRFWPRGTNENTFTIFIVSRR